MYIVIVGAGKVGEYLARTTLEEGHEVVLIERDPERADEMAVGLRGRERHRGGGYGPVPRCSFGIEEPLTAAIRQTGGTIE